MSLTQCIKKICQLTCSFCIELTIIKQLEIWRLCDTNKVKCVSVQRFRNKLSLSLFRYITVRKPKGASHPRTCPFCFIIYQFKLHWVCSNGSQCHWYFAPFSRGNTYLYCVVCHSWLTQQTEPRHQSMNLSVM